MYSAKAVERAAATLAQRRQQAKDEGQRRRREVYAAQPRLEELTQSLRRTAMEVATAAMAPDGPQRVEELSRAIRGLQAQKTALLADIGLTPQDLEPPYHCALCQDTGLDSGLRCSCFEELIRLESCRSLPSAAQEGRYSFDNFDLSYYPDTADRAGISPRKAMANILERCRRYARDFGEHSPSLLFQGRTGLGKTHLSLAIATQVAAQGHAVLYTSVQGLVDRYERVRFDKSPTAQDREFLELAPRCDLLVLDDLGAEFLSSFSQSVLYNVLNDRIMAQRPMLLSTNLEPAQLSASYGDRIASRILCESVAYTFYGNDIRLEKRKQELLGAPRRPAVDTSSR